MARYVIDASVAVEYLLKTAIGQVISETLTDATFIAPELIDAEVLSVLRRAWLFNRLDLGRVQMAVDDLVLWE